MSIRLKKILGLIVLVTFAQGCCSPRVIEKPVIETKVVCVGQKIYLSVDEILCQNGLCVSDETARMIDENNRAVEVCD